MNVTEPCYWPLAVAHLSEADPIMADLIARCPPTRMQSRGDPFTTLARAITGQQISVKAADTVWRKLLNLTEITPQAIIGQPVQGLRDCGYSQRKVEYLHDLARHFAEGLVDFSAWAEMEDSAIIAALTQIRGIGQWSAEMFLMFNLLRPDVFPLADIGLQKAIALHYPRMAPQDKIAWRQHADRWRPWRSVATWYLWRSLDVVAVAY